MPWKLAKKNIVLNVLLAVILTACALPKAQYGLDYNVERTKLGLTTIPDNWEVGGVRGGESTWRNPEREDKYIYHQPVYYSKYLSYPTGSLSFETDLYYGKQDFTNFEGTFREHLEITYYYPNSACKSGCWGAHFFSEETYAARYIISIEKADEILESWGLSRFGQAIPWKLSLKPFRM
jgi:hypothetical protein